MSVKNEGARTLLQKNKEQQEIITTRHDIYESPNNEGTRTLHPHVLLYWLANAMHDIFIIIFPLLAYQENERYVKHMI